MQKLIFMALNFAFIGSSYCQKREDVIVLTEGSATVAVSRQYSDIPLYRRLLMGKNYRKTWDTPVKLPVFAISVSGFNIESLGGSKQTNSLYLRDKNHELWVLRSVDKDVKKGIPGFLRITPFKEYKQDIVSAAHPFAALIASELARSTGIIAPEPVYFFVADDPALGSYRSIFANSVCMLEKRDPTPDHSITIETDSVKNKLGPNTGYRLLQKEFLKARLLDMLMGDWDRHEGQWRWGIKDSGSLKYIYPVPRDRDHSLFYTRGLIPGLSKQTFEPWLTGFNKKGRGLKKLNKKAWNLDRMFLNELQRSDWEAITRKFQGQVSDAVIETAVNKLPPEILQTDGKEIKQKLKSRRDRLFESVIEYYTWLSN